MENKQKKENIDKWVQSIPEAFKDLLIEIKSFSFCELYFKKYFGKKWMLPFHQREILNKIDLTYGVLQKIDLTYGKSKHPDGKEDKHLQELAAYIICNIAFGRTEIVNALISNEGYKNFFVDVNPKYYLGRIIFQMAVLFNQKDILNLLLKRVTRKKFFSQKPYYLSTIKKSMQYTSKESFECFFQDEKTLFLSFNDLNNYLTSLFQKNEMNKGQKALLEKEIFNLLKGEECIKDKKLKNCFDNLNKHMFQDKNTKFLNIGKESPDVYEVACRQAVYWDRLDLIKYLVGLGEKFWLNSDEKVVLEEKICAILNGENKDNGQIKDFGDDSVKQIIQNAMYSNINELKSFLEKIVEKNRINNKKVLLEEKIFNILKEKHHIKETKLKDYLDNSAHYPAKSTGVKLTIPRVFLFACLSYEKVLVQFFIENSYIVSKLKACKLESNREKEIRLSKGMLFQAAQIFKKNKKDELLEMVKRRCEVEKINLNELKTRRKTYKVRDEQSKIKLMMEKRTKTLSDF